MLPFFLRRGAVAGASPPRFSAAGTAPVGAWTRPCLGSLRNPQDRLRLRPSPSRIECRFPERSPLEWKAVRRSKRQAQQAHSAGGVVVRPEPEGLHVAMIATRGRSRWGLPKGAPNPEESVAEAAIREVWEETGIHAEIISLLDRIEYFFRANDKLIRKEVDFFLMRYVEGTIRPQLTEVDDVEWVELGEAIERASFESEKRILAMVEQAWRAGAPEAPRPAPVAQNQ